jgi:hypothetical protein
MKKITFTLAAILFSTVVLQAQENDKTRNIQEETITKTTTVKGITEETTVTKTIEEKKQVIEVKDTGLENQEINYSTKKDETINHSSTEIIVNKENEAAIESVKQKQQEEIKASKEAQKQKYEAERLVLEKKAAADAKRKKDSIHEKYKRENN